MLFRSETDLAGGADGSAREHDAARTGLLACGTGPSARGEGTRAVQRAGAGGARAGPSAGRCGAWAEHGRARASAWEQAREERGAGCSGEEGEKGWAEGKSWAGHSVGLGFVFLSYFLSPFLF